MAGLIMLSDHHRRRAKLKLIAIACTAFLTAVLTTNTAIAATSDVTLNGLHVSVDNDTGSILRLAYDGPGTILEQSPQRAGMIDLAYPIDKFEPLRLASRFSHGAQVKVQTGSLTVEWNHLGASRPFELAGDVSAKVEWRAADDGQSIILTAHVENHSKIAVHQVIFPDFAGLKPFLGKQDTLFRAGGAISAPFLELAPTEASQSQQYMLNASAGSADFVPGGLANSMVSRWMDFGGLGGGFSLFPRRWGWQPQVAIRLHLSETDDTLRLMCLHDVSIPPDGKWDSGEFWLTPHQGGWARGIEPYRTWVKKNFTRTVPISKHVKEGLGFRTAWMCQNQPNDPQDAVFTFKDLPKLAQDAKENGLDEIVMFNWDRGFILPLPPPYPHIGTESEMVQAVAACKKIGVNVVPFISVLQANEQTAPRYGLHVVDNNGWTFHTELIPRWNPPYAHGFACIPIPVTNPLWQKDVLDGAKHLIDIGVTSLAWDQFMAVPEKPNINTLADQIRAVARAKDPESSFAGEELYNFEVDSAQLDYTWDWISQGDYRPMTSVFPAPRINECITASPMAVKQAFADNRFINAMPRKKESINASDYIASAPDFAAALKQCAALRKQFLPYFTDGELIGECILSDPAPTARVCAYVLPDRVLMIVLNNGAAGPLNLKIDLRPWCHSPTGNYQMKPFSADGKALPTQTIRGTSTVASNSAVGELFLYEFTSG
jgi:hypothetical protein